MSWYVWLDKVDGQIWPSLYGCNLDVMLNSCQSQLGCQSPSQSLRKKEQNCQHTSLWVVFFFRQHRECGSGSCLLSILTDGDRDDNISVKKKQTKQAYKPKSFHEVSTLPNLSTLHTCCSFHSSSPSMLLPPPPDHVLEEEEDKNSAPGWTGNVNNGINAAVLLRGIQSIKVNELARHTYLWLTTEATASVLFYHRAFIAPNP